MYHTLHCIDMVQLIVKHKHLFAPVVLGSCLEMKVWNVRIVGLLSAGMCGGCAAHLTMQSCMILFQSSPVTIRKRTVIALPAVEKLACL